jgi:hypothetical protein
MELKVLVDVRVNVALEGSNASEIARNMVRR